MQRLEPQELVKAHPERLSELLKGIEPGTVSRLLALDALDALVINFSRLGKFLLCPFPTGAKLSHSVGQCPAEVFYHTSQYGNDTAGLTPKYW